MKAIFSRLTTFDWVKLSLYGVAACGALTVVALNTILKPWGVSDSEIAVISARVGSISAVFGLVGIIANTIKNVSPPSGYVPVITPLPSTPLPNPSAVPQPSVLTTTEVVKKGL